MYASATYDKDTGLVPNDAMNRYAMRLNVGQELFPWAKLGFTSYLTHRIRNAGTDRTFS